MLEVRDVYKSYRKQNSLFSRKRYDVLNGVSFLIKKGECVGLIGESGSGKSTLSRLILGLERPDSGSITIEGEDIIEWNKCHKGDMSVVFQDYTTSANPRFTVQDIIAEPLLALKKAENIKVRVAELLNKVELPKILLKRYPHELSGGQLQRVCLARAISTKPRFIVLDEALSSLDVSVQAQILKLLNTLKNDLNMTYLFIAHDLQTITNICDRVLFLQQGRIVEQLLSSQLSFAKSDYAQKLLASVITFSA